MSSHRAMTLQGPAEPEDGLAKAVRLDSVSPPVASGTPPSAPASPVSRPFDPRSITPDEVETLYVEHRPLLLFVACRKFSVAESDAENLIQEVFLSLLQTCARIENVRAWLVAATCNASRYYWRVQGRTEPPPENFETRSDPDSLDLADRFAMQMTMQQVLGYLQPRCQETLRLHYFEGRSAVEVARELETTHRYAEKLIHNCLARAREIYKSITAVKR
jgi:RNA polymerase sigma factor (sigma-70 family)